MIKMNNDFVAENGTRVILTLVRNLNRTYDINYTVIGSTEKDNTYGYLTEVGRVGSKWYVTDMNLDNYDTDYEDKGFSRLSELIEYIGIKEIETKHWFCFY